MSLLPRPLSPHPLLRAILLLVGAVALLGGAAWSATAAGFGPAAEDSGERAPQAAAAEPAPEVKLTGEGLVAWLDALGALEGLDQVAENAPFGAKKFFEAKTGLDFLPFVRDKITAAVGSGISLAELDTKLDDLDGDGKPESDFHEIPGVTVDLDVDLAARSTPGAYDATVVLKANAAADSPLTMSLDGLKVNGRDAQDALKLDLTTTLRLDPTAANKVVIVADQAAVGTVRLGVSGSYDGTANPLAFRVGVLGVRGTGTVSADAGVRVTLKDPNSDGVIDLTELASPTALFRTACVSDGAQVDLTVTAELAGITGKVGRLQLDDPTLCNGLAAPDVELGDLAQFRSVTLADVVNGLAQVTQALKSAQAAGDVPIPFVQEPLRDLVAVNEKLVGFFVDNGFTEADNPMASISVDTAETAAVKTLQDLAPRLAAALGMSPDALGLTYDAGRVLLTVKTSADPAAEPGTVDFGNLLSGVGITEVTGRATASVDPAYSLDLGIGFDLAPGKPLDQRFFITNGSSGSVATLDAAVSADLDVSATASVLGLRLTDAEADGAVPLLQRKDPDRPMLTVAVTDPDQDGRTTLAELSAAAALPVKATVNATVPSTTLTAEANAVGIPLGAGTVTLAWPTVPDTSGSGALKVTASQTFLDTALPFAFDSADPRALVGQVLTVTRETITRMRAAVADGNATTTKPLPLVGRSVADLDPLLVKIQDTVDRLIQANDLATLPALEAELDQLIAQALGSADPATGIVDLVYEPRTASTPATVLVDLDLGVCSPGRASGRDGCTITAPAVKEPFNLDLGTGSRVGGVAGVGTTGELQVEYDARAHLTFGVQLPTVTAGATPSSLPTVSGAPKLVVQDDASVDLGLGAELDGVLSAGLGPVQVSLGKPGDGEPKAQAAVAARFRLKAPTTTGKRLVVGSGEFTTWLNSLLPKAGSVTVHEQEDGLKATCAGVTAAVDACAALPVYSGDTALGTVRFTAPDLLTPSGWTVDSTEVEANLKNEAIQFSLLVDGVRTLTRQVGDGLRSLPTGTRIPLLGTDVTAGADVLDTFDTQVLAKVQTLADEVATVATAAQIKQRAETALTGLPGGATPTVTLTCRPESGTGPAQPCTGIEPVARLQSLQVDVLVSTSTSVGTGAFDLGFPGLRLASEDELTASAGLEFRLGFGVDRDLGFYVPTTGAQPEIALTAGVELPHQIEGDLAFIPVRITDDKDSQASGKDVSVSAGLDLTTSRSDGRLPLADLGRAQFSPKLEATADLLLGLQTQRPAGAPSALPTFGATLDMGTTLSWNGSSATPTFSNERIRFDDVTIDAGSLVSDFLKPVAKTLHTYTAPLEKPIDAIRKPIPAVAEAARMAGKPAPTWYDAFKAADQAANGGQSKGVQLIDRVIQLTDLVRAFDNPSVPSGSISLGSFDVLPTRARTPVPVSQADTLIGAQQATDKDVLGSLRFEGADALGAARGKGGFSFPAFEKPASLFGMLLGKDVTLAYFDAGRLEVKRGFQFSYPLGPARLYIGGGAGVEGHFAAGFDTYGVRKAFEVLSDDDESNDGAWEVAKGLLQGLYLDDFDQAGQDVPEIRFSAYLSAGAAVGVPGIEAGAEGGVEGNIEFNLKTDDTGKLRYTGIAQQLKINKNPLCFFDASATVDAYVKAYVDTFFGKATYPIVNKRIYHQADLFSFCNTKQEEENLLAELQDGGVLVFRTDASVQDITVTQQDTDTVEVAARLNGQDVVETYDGVVSMVADLKGGDDLIDVRQADATLAGLPVTVCGGSDNDRILVAAGRATVFGDSGGSCAPAPTAGADDITTGSGADVVDGGPDGDTVDTGSGADELDGGDGDDVLRGGLGDDRVDGGSGEDSTDYSDHTEDVTIDLATHSGQAGEADETIGIEQVVGGAGDDTVTIPADQPLQVDGGYGDDVVTGGTGTALVVGGEGADRFVGGTGAAQFMGAGGDDVLVDGPGSQTFLGMEGHDTIDYSAVEGPVRVDLDGEPGDGPIGSGTDNIIDADLVLGTAHADQLVGSGADEELRGGGGADVLEGGGGADVLLGEGEADQLVGNAGNDELQGGGDADDLQGRDGDDRLDGGAGDDRVHGGSGADDLRGGGDFDTVDYADRTEALRVTKDDAALDGAGFGVEHDNVHRDVERYLGSSGTDEVTGWSGDEVFEGNGGDDYLAGGDGTDTFLGGDGSDNMYDRDFNARFDTDETHADTFTGGTGNDSAYGNGGTDTFDMGDGTDFVDSGPAVDTITGGEGDDEVYAGAGNDLVDGQGGDDNLRGEDGDDQLRAGPAVTGSATIWGGLGADTIWNGTVNGGSVVTGTGGGTETDTSTNTVYGYDGKAGYHSSYTGGLGKDVFLLDGGTSVDLVYPAGGDDVVNLGPGDDTLYASDGDETADGGAGTDNVYGGAGDDTLVGGTGRDTVNGEAGDDTLAGGDDDDTLWGGAGDDALDGGDDADMMEGEAGTDTVSYAGRSTAVVVKEDGNYTDGGVEDQSSRPGYERYFDHVDDTIERIIGGSGDDRFSIGNQYRVDPAVLVGGPGNDVLTTRSAVPTTFVGGPGDDDLNGGGGADTFDQGTGPDGADILSGGGGADIADYRGRPAGTVQVTYDDVANDGQPGEGDNVRADIESAPGGDVGEEPEVTLALDPVTVVEGAASTTTPARFTVRLSAATTAPVTVPWTVTGVTATAGVDFGTGSGTVTVPAGQTSATFDVPVLGDALDESDETATVTVGSAPGSTAIATLTITDDDVTAVTPPMVVPQLTVRPVSVLEGKKGTRTMTFQVVLSAPTSVPVSVRLATANGSAKAKKDYLASTQVVTFAPGQTTATFTVKVKGDKAKEKNETVKVVASNPVNLTLGPLGVGTIRNDDKRGKK